MGIKVTVKEVGAWDKKFADKAKAAAASGGQSGAKAAKVAGDYEVELKCKVALDGKSLSASCTWLIKQGSVIFPNLKQSKSAKAAADVNPDKIAQAQVDDVVSGAAEAELTGIAKKLAEWEAQQKKK